jgi:hypothetical protein
LILRRALASLSFILLFSTVALAEKRVALVIGNSAYVKVAKLDNPKNDATAMEEMFKAAGFDTVMRSDDLNVGDMRRALREFSDTSYDADIAVVFYAGHGMEVSGINYLIPTDAVLERDIDVQDEAISLDRVNQVLGRAKQLRLVILDACRDNPFVRSMRRTIATRTVRSGYGEIDEKSLPPNTLVAYAQRAGAFAEDGTGNNSPYTTALLKHLPTPGLDIELALRRVRDDVLKSTRNRQEPFKYGSLGGTEIVLVAGKPLPPPISEPKAPARLSEAGEAWSAVKDTKSLIVLQAFIVRYKDTFYATLAQERVVDLKNNALATGSIAPKNGQPGPAELKSDVADALERTKRPSSIDYISRPEDALKARPEEPKPQTVMAVPAPVQPLPATTPPVARVLTGAERLKDANFSALSGKRIGLITNQTGMIGTSHLADLLTGAPNVQLVAIFAPEHGFLGRRVGERTKVDLITPVSPLGS